MILEELGKLAPLLVFSFVDEDNSRMKMPDRHPHGETHLVHYDASTWFIYCGIHVRFLRVLLSPESSLAEKTLARFGFAVTVSLLPRILVCDKVFSYDS